mgnify:FL=1
MKLKNIAKKNNKSINLQLKKVNLFIIPDEEFEVDDKYAKELLNTTIDDKPIVEKLAVSKPKEE